jgi:RNA polymerase sigma-70 factor (ECF subfamily)
MSDLDLVSRFCRGDAAAFDGLVQRHKEYVYNLIYRMTGDREWAEDITVEVFFQTHRSLRSFRHEARFLTWLHRLAINVCMNEIRQQKSKRRLEELPLSDSQVGDDSLADSVITRELADRIIQAMQVLPETHRATMTMFYMDGRSCQEIADILHIPRATVKTRIFYATRVLRDRLRATGVIPETVDGV